MRIAIINGPNLNLLGKRETDIYGSQDFESYLKTLESSYPDIDIQYYQSNVEGELITAIQDFSQFDGIVLNGAAYTHTSVGLGDAVAAAACPVVEVHISNIHAREAYRMSSYTAPHAAGVITGFGLDGYRLAVEHLRLLNRS